MAGRKMEALRHGSALDVDRLSACEAKDAVRGTVRFLTLDYSELYCSRMEPEHFFVREMELYDLKELLMLGGRHLISGIGGVGKTELLRQLLAWCIRTQAADCIAVVQYEESLMSSFARCFRSVKGASTEEQYQERTVLFLDNRQ